MPLFILTLINISLITLQTRSYSKDKSHKNSIISNTMITGTTFGFIFMFTIVIETTFGLDGMGQLFIDALNQYDYWLIIGVLFIILIMFVIITLISNLIFSLYKFLVYKFQFNSTLNDKAMKETENNEIRSEEIITENLSLKKYLLNKVKSQLFIIAAILIIFFIFIAIFPSWFTPYSFEEVTGYYTGSWGPPSSDHPLGTALFGRDILGLTIWGIRDALIFGFGAVVIGLLGGLIFGIISRISFFIRPRIKHSVALVIYDCLIYSIIIGLVITFFTYLIFGFTAILIGLIGGLILGFIVGILSFIISRIKRSDEQINFYPLLYSVIIGSMVALSTFLIFGTTAFLIGLIGGLIFGFIFEISYIIISRVKRSDEPVNFRRLVHNVILGSMIIFSIFPGIIFILLSRIFLGDCQLNTYFFPYIYSCEYYYWVSLSVIGILLIPLFT